MGRQARRADRVMAFVLVDSILRRTAAPCLDTP